MLKFTLANSLANTSINLRLKSMPYTVIDVVVSPRLNCVNKLLIYLITVQRGWPRALVNFVQEVNWYF